jgi:hypothetical protein
MQAVPAHIDQDPGRSKPPSTTSSGDEHLIHRAGRCERNQNDEEQHFVQPDLLPSQ